MATAEEIKGWLDNNQDKAGTNDFVIMTDEYNKLNKDQPTAAPEASGLRKTAEFFGWPKLLPEGAPLPTLEERLQQDRNQDPNSAGNIGERLFTNVITAVPDTGIALYNAGARTTGNPNAQVDYLAPQMRAAAGGKEMPADASPWQRYGEGMLAAAFGGPRALVPAGAGLVGSELASSDTGAKLGEAIGLDRETMGLIGGFAGGATPRAVGNIGRGAIAAGYRGHGNPDAPETYTMADRHDVRPTAGMLGNQGVQDLEASLQRKPGSGPTIDAARLQARQDMANAVQGVANAQGATTARPTVIGQQARTVAGNALDALERESSGAQHTLEHAVGERTPINVGGLDRQMADLIGQHPSDSPTTPEITGPIQARLNSLRSMYPPLAPDEQGPVAPRVAYEQGKDWSGILRREVNGMAPLSEQHATPIQHSMREAMRNTAIQQGVPPQLFDAAQTLTRDLTRDDTGYRDTLGPTAEATNKSAYKQLLRGGEGDPERLEAFRTGANAAMGPAGDPAVNSIFGSHLQRILNETFNKRRGHAPGPINYAERIEEIDPRSLSQYGGGPVGAQVLEDVAALARQLHRPTVQGGASKALSDITGSAIATAAKPLITGATALASGADAGMSAALAGLASKLPFHPINNMRTQMMQSEPALAAMAGRPTPLRPGVDINDIRAALTAIQGATNYGPSTMLPSITVEP